MRLTEKIAIVTGGCAGIGEAIAHKFAREGASVLVADLPGMPVQDTVGGIVVARGKAVAFEGDLSDEEQARACVEAAVAAFGQVDILANNAGVFPQVAAVAETEIAMFDYLLRNNARTALLMTKFAVPELRKTRGVIVYTGSIGGIQGVAQIAPYSATKGFIHALMQGVAQEEARNGIRANAVAPGAIISGWVTAGAGGPITDEMVKANADAAPLGRCGTPEEMANVACFLASGEASYVTAAIFVADGGVSISQGVLGNQVPDELRREPEPSLPLRHRYNGFIGKQVVGGHGQPEQH